MSNFMFQDISNFVIFSALLKNAKPVCAQAHEVTRNKIAARSSKIRSSSAVIPRLHPAMVIEPRDDAAKWS